MWQGHCLFAWQCLATCGMLNQGPTCAFWLGNFWSPDLSDFFLSPQLKKSLGGHWFATNARVKNAVNSFFHQQAPDFFEAGMHILSNVVLSVQSLWKLFWKIDTLKLAIQLSFITFRHVRAIFRELFREIANQSLYTSHNIAHFIHLWFCKKLDEKLSLSPLWCFVKVPIVWWERRNERWKKWLVRWFTKCHLYTYRFSHFANIFSRSRQFDDKCIAGFKAYTCVNFSHDWQTFRYLWNFT